MAETGSRITTKADISRRGIKDTGVDIEVIIFNIIRNWWIILIGCMITAFASYIVISERYTPTYYAEATFVVTSKDGGSDTVYSNLVVASKLADSFSYVLESPVLQQKIAESLDMPAFSGGVTAKHIENTNLIQIGVETLSPQVAFEEINGIIKYHHIVSDNLMGNAVLDVLKAPTVPAAPLQNMNRTAKVITYTLIAALAIIALLVIASVASDEIMTENDLVTRVDCPALATIYHERKNLSLRARLQGAKTSMLITNPTTSFRFAETYRLFRTRLEYLLKRKGHKVIMVSSALENEGKTTSAANTAIILALNNYKVLLIDGDMLKPALYKALTSRVKRGTSISEVIVSDIGMEDIPTMEGLPTLSLLLGKTSLSNSTEIIGSEEMKDFLTRARDYFDYIVIDTPPISVASDAECFAELADCTLLVIKQGAARARRINDCIDAVSQSGTDMIGCIFNNVYPLDFLSLSGSERGTDSYRTSGYGNSYRSGYGYSYGRGYYGYGYGYSQKYRSDDEGGERK
ncbi:MAG: polysaccharide biosynthesis tyrosine autokinase [Clostridia bacterium]|nr:polysaccharide biosynthesis tyrosine autokinase [Clostridia bacterium]